MGVLAKHSQNIFFCLFDCLTDLTETFTAYAMYTSFFHNIISSKSAA